MTFKKLALATAIACVPMASFAVDVLDDADLASATGQDGIRIALDLAVTTDTIVHDTDGIASFADYAVSATTTVISSPNTSFTFDGGIYIDNMSIDATNNGSGAADGVVVLIDAGDSASVSTAPMLNINVQLGSTTINTGDIYIVNSNRDSNAGASWGTDTALATATPIISKSQIVLGSGVQLNIQLGNEAQSDGLSTALKTHMVAIDTTIAGGLTISNSAINDANSGGAIRVGSITAQNSGNTNLNATVYADVTGTGLAVTIGRLGDAGGMNVYMTDVVLGSAGAGVIGDIEMRNLSLAGTVLEISGK